MKRGRYLEPRSARILRGAALAAAALVCGAVPLRAALDLSGAITRQQTILLDGLARGTTQPSIIKLREPLVDEARGRVYFAGTLSPYLGAIDANTDTLVDSMDLGIHGYLSKVMALDKTTGVVYIVTLEDTQLYRVDPFAKTVSAPISVSGGGAVAVDGAHQRVYVAATGMIREYDTSLQLQRTLAANVMAVELDPSGTYLYTTASVNPSSVTVYNRSTFAKIATVAMPPGRKAAFLSVDGNNRVYVGCQPPYLAIISTQASSTDFAIRTTVSISTNVNNMATYGNYLYMMTGYPFVAGYMPTSDGAYGVVEVHDKTTGALVTSVQAGLQGEGVAIHAGLGKMYVGNTGDSHVDVFDLATNARIKRIDTATSVEDIAVRPSDGALVVRNRLGGGDSILFVSNPSGSATVSDAPNSGNWPSKTILDGGTTTVYTLSHYESRISAFDFDALQAKTGVSLGVAKLRADGLSTMAFDPAGRKAYAVLPELGQVTWVNVDTGQTGAPVTISGFDTSQADGPGLLQIAVNGSLGRVYLLDAQNKKKLYVYDGALTLLRSSDVASNFPSSLNDTLDLLFSDEAAGRLYVGPLIFDVTSGGEQYAGRLNITDGQGYADKVVAVYPEGDRLYAADYIPPTSASAHDGYERLLEFQRSSPSSVLRTFSLTAIDKVKSAFAFDFPRGLAYAGYFGPGQIDVLKIGAVVAAADVSSPTVPSGLAAASASSSRINLSWTASTDNVGVAGYKVYRDGVKIATAATISYADSGLTPNTTYVYAVAAYDAAGNASANSSSASAATAAVPPAASPSPFLSVSTAGLTAAWLADGNSAGTTYYVQLSSTPGFSPVLQSTRIPTLNAYFSGLSPNTSYYVQAAALSLQTSTWTAFAALGSTSTLAAPPAPAPPSSIGTSSVTANWSANGNAAGTAYIAQVSTDGFATVNASSRTLNASAAFLGLNANTTYYLQVQAVGNNGLATPFTALPSTMTLLISPGVAGITFTTVGVSSITVNWTSGGNGPGTNYITQLSTDNFATINLSSNTLNLGALFGTGGAGLALTPNTTYYFRARAASGSNVSGFTSLGSTFTLAAPPAATAFSAVNITSATVNWSLNFNPVSTLAEVQRSSDNVVFASVFTGAALSFIDGGLLSCTTYYVRVRNWNGGGVATAFDGTAQFKTLASIPMAPGALAAVPIAGNRISLSWTASPTEDVTAYRLYSDGGTGVVDYAEPLAVLASTETSFTTGVLASSASYRFALRAKNRCGVEETGGVFASAASIGALSAVSSAVTAPQSGRRIAGDRVTLVAELVNGSAAQARSVLFQYKASASPAWLDVSTVTSSRTNPVFTAPYFAHWDVTGLPAASYDLRAVATSVDGVVDAAPPAVTVIVDPDGFDVREKLDGGRIRREHVVYNGAANVIQTADEGTLLTKITLPAGALDSASATLTVVGNSVLPGPAPSGWTDVAVKAQITLSNGQTILSGGQTAALTFHYPDANNDGAIDNTRFKAAALKLYGFDAAAGRWVQDLQSVVLDASARAISGGTRHFSFFAAFAPATATGLDAVRVYPVPFKPYGLNADAGRPFASGNPDSGIVFDNLPTAVTIKIYTLTGRLVAQLSANDGAGRVQWNARNDSGAEAASGGYFAVIRSPGQDRVVKKLSIIR